MLIADNIRTRRTELGISQEKLSEILNVHRNTIAFIEVGKRSASYDMLEKLAKALKCEPYELLKEPQKNC